MAGLPTSKFRRDRPQPIQTKIWKCGFTSYACVILGMQTILKSALSISWKALFHGCFSVVYLYLYFTFGGIGPQCCHGHTNLFLHLGPSWPGVQGERQVI